MKHGSMEKYLLLRCKKCGRHFLRGNQQYEFCSKCRRTLAEEKTDGMDERAQQRRRELKNELVYSYWYNRMRKLQRDKAADPELTAAVGEVFAALRDEAVQRRKEAGQRGKKVIPFTGRVKKSGKN